MFSPAEWAGFRRRCGPRPRCKIGGTGAGFLQAVVGPAVGATCFGSGLGPGLARALAAAFARRLRPANQSAGRVSVSRQGTIMHRSTYRILTTHVGSLIRPESVRAHLRAKQKGEGYDAAAHAANLKETVAEVVRQQAEVGVDVVSDGEFGKGISWSQYVIERVSGFEKRVFNPATGNPFTKGADRERFTDFYKELDAKDHVETVTDTVALAPIKYTGQALIQQDIDNFKAALKNVKAVEGFLPVAAPASVIPDRKNEYYKSDEELAEPIGQPMHVEYKQVSDNCHDAR